MSKRIEYKPGERVGECVYLHDVRKKNVKRRAKFRCIKCDEQNTFEANIADVKGLKTVSCGCYGIKQTKRHNTKHGMSDKRIYFVWKNMIVRCCDKNNKNYKYYGGRGICVCEEWRSDFTAFYNHVASLPNYNNVGYSLDRRNNNGNYEPGNVRWADKYTQSQNRSNSLHL